MGLLYESDLERSSAILSLAKATRAEVNQKIFSPSIVASSE
jgi:hypothetical protein